MYPGPYPMRNNRDVSMPSSPSNSLIYATMLYVGAIICRKVDHIRANLNNKPLTARTFGNQHIAYL